MPERFVIYIVYKRRYINTLPFLSATNEHSATHTQTDRHTYIDVATTLADYYSRYQAPNHAWTTTHKTCPYCT